MPRHEYSLAPIAAFAAPLLFSAPALGGQDLDQPDDSGLEAEFLIDNEFFVGLQGDEGDAATWSSELELELGLDFEAMLGWSGWAAGMVAKANRGDALAASSGETLAFSGAADDRGELVEELWLQKHFAKDRISFLLGRYAADNDFDVREAADVFVNAGFEEGPELAEAGGDGGAVVPLPGLGARLNLAITPGLAFRIAVIEGDTEEVDPDAPADEGYFYIAELDWSPSQSPETRVGLGVWHHTGDFQRLIEQADASFKTGVSGYYAFAEGPIYHGRQNPDLVVSAFARIGLTDDEVAAIDSHRAIGLVVGGLIPQRADDRLGLGLTSISNSSDYRRASVLEGEPISDRETAIELTYIIQATDWLIVQPTLQCALNRDGDPEVARACAAGLGLRLEF
ncbi:MAG: carbohydrate porin [Wenzhouxiangella sp.]|jgi:carbohydrate-selective porin OprB|nr:carbohydrate porin [Wenzhouxiangella sp.]